MRFKVGALAWTVYDWVVCLEDEVRCGLDAASWTGVDIVRWGLGRLDLEACYSVQEDNHGVLTTHRSPNTPPKFMYLFSRYFGLLTISYAPFIQNNTFTY